MSGTLAGAFWRNFLGDAPDWYKWLIVACLAANPLLLALAGPVVTSWAMLFEFIEGAELVIHNAPFDVGFLDAELAKAGVGKATADYCRVIDTLVVARQLHPGQRNSLDALCKRYGVDNSRRDLHGALLDARILVDVYLAMTGGQAALTLDGDPATVLWVVLITHAERKFIIERGLNDFLNVLDEKGHSFVLDEGRKSFIRTKK